METSISHTLIRHLTYQAAVSSHFDARNCLNSGNQRLKETV